MEEKITSLAPVCLFVYNRLTETKQTIEALQKNYLASESDLIIFSDGAKDYASEEKVKNVRAYLETISGFRTVTIHKSLINKGLADSIIDGVTQVINDIGKVIVLEDDLLTSPNFLQYMNDGLNFYRHNQQVIAVCGYSIPITIQGNQDVYFTHRSSSWGWSTWKDRWEKVDWEIADYRSFLTDTVSRKAFNKMGSDMCGMLDRQMTGEISSWAIRFCYHQFRNHLFSVHPVSSKVKNIGFNSEDASNTKERFNRYDTMLDISGKKKFHFVNEIKLEPAVISQFVKPFSILMRVKYKIINTLFK